MRLLILAALAFAAFGFSGLGVAGRRDHVAGAQVCGLEHGGLRRGAGERERGTQNDCNRFTVEVHLILLGDNAHSGEVGTGLPRHIGFPQTAAGS